MKWNEGRIGKQEGASAALIACTVCGAFSVNTHTLYENGNSSYLSTALSGVLALLAFFLVAESMRRAGCMNLAALYRLAFGRFFAPVMGFATLAALLYSATLPLIRLMMILCRFVYIESSVPQVAFYFLLCVLVLSWLGLEIIGRTSRLFVLWIVLSFVLAFVIAIPSYETFRLYPLLGDGLYDVFLHSLTGIARFFPALLCLLVCGRGLQGLACAALEAKIGALGGAAIACSSQFCLGMTYPTQMLAMMHSPMYRITMSVRTGSSYLRTDKLLLFFWTLGGMLASGFFTYSGALLYAEASNMRDIRPTAVLASVLVAALALLGQLNLVWFEKAADFLWTYAWLFMLLPPLTAAMLANLKRRRTP